MAMDQIAAAEAKLGKFLQVVYSNGLFNQISDVHRDWEMVSKQRVSEEAAQSIKYMVQTAYGAPAVQWSKQGAGGAFPDSDQVTTEEAEAGFNQLYSTVEIGYDLWQRALKTPHKYAEPLANEIKAKGIVQKRLLSAAFHLDGGGSLGVISATADAPNDNVKISFSSLGARYCEFGDYLQPGTAAGVAQDADASSPDSYYVVLTKDRDDNSVVCELRDSTGTKVAYVDATHGIAASNLAVGDYVRRRGNTVVNQTYGSNEVNNLTEMMPGLESLGADDGRVLHGLAQEGALAGTTYDAGAAAADISHIQGGLDKLKTITGDGTYRYKQILSSPETMSAFINSNETDRRLIDIKDNKRGAAGFGYVHGADTLEFATTEFTRADRMWVIPEGSKESGILEFHGKDFCEVKAGSQGEFLKQNGSGKYVPAIQKFMMGYMTLICKRPSALLSIRNFTV